MKLIYLCAAAFAPMMSAGPVSAETLKIKVADVAAGQDTVTWQPTLTLTLSPESTAALGVFTAARLGEPVKVRIGDRVLAEPIIREAIVKGVVTINGGFAQGDAEELASAIMKAGGNLEVDGSDK